MVHIASKENSWQLHIKLNIHLTIPPIITTPGSLPKRNENLCSYKNLLQFFFFIIAQNWKQPTCPSTGKLMNKMCWIIHWNTIQQ